jgi:hypothetical protein
MSVVTRFESDHYPRPEEPCSFCGERARLPRVEWWVADGALIICADCCRELRRALVPDLTRIVAYDDFTRFRCEGVAVQ